MANEPAGAPAISKGPRKPRQGRQDRATAAQPASPDPAEPTRAKADPATAQETLVAPIIQEAKAHSEAQLRAAKNRDFDAIVKEELTHAARQAHAAETVLEYEAVRDMAISSVPEEQRLDALLESTCLMLGSHAAALLLMDEEGEQLWPRASLGFETTLGVRPMPVTGIMRDIVRTGKPVILAEVQPDQEFRAGLIEEGIHSLLAVPLRMNGGMGGVLVCGHRERDWFEPADADLLQALAGLIAGGLQRARTLETQKRRRRRSEHASRFKSELLNMATHDIKTPLTTMALHLQMMADANLSEAQRQLSVATMQRNVARLTAMLDDFLDLARVQGDRLTIHPGKLRVADLFQEAFETFEPLAKQNGMRLEVDPAGGLEVVGDERRVTQVIANLVSNAIRYSSSGSTIRLTAQDAPDLVEIHVKDEGRGLAPEQLGRLFQPFVQVHESAGNSKGSGLGLYLSKAIVGAHGGRLWLASEGPGRGTDAAFTLPKEKPRAEGGTPAA